MNDLVELFVRDYFQEFFPANFSGEYLALLPELDEFVQFRIMGADRIEQWSARKTGNRLLLLPGARLPVRSSYQLSVEVFLEIVSGRRAPQSAFFARELAIEGNLLFALRIGALLEIFFREHPYERAVVQH